MYLRQPNSREHWTPYAYDSDCSTLCHCAIGKQGRPRILQKDNFNLYLLTGWMRGYRLLVPKLGNPSLFSCEWHSTKETQWDNAIYLSWRPNLTKDCDVIKYSLLFHNHGLCELYYLKQTTKLMINEAIAKHHLIDVDVAVKVNDDYDD